MNAEEPPEDMAETELMNAAATADAGAAEDDVPAGMVDEPDEEDDGVRAKARGKAARSSTSSCEGDACFCAGAFELPGARAAGARVARSGRWLPLAGSRVEGL